VPIDCSFKLGRGIARVSVCVAGHFDFPIDRTRSRRSEKQRSPDAFRSASNSRSVPIETLLRLLILYSWQCVVSMILLETLLQGHLIRPIEGMDNPKVMVEFEHCFLRSRCRISSVCAVLCSSLCIHFLLFALPLTCVEELCPSAWE